MINVELKRCTVCGDSRIVGGLLATDLLQEKMILEPLEKYTNSFSNPISPTSIFEAKDVYVGYKAF